MRLLSVPFPDGTYFEGEENFVASASPPLRLASRPPQPSLGGEVGGERERGREGGREATDRPTVGMKKRVNRSPHASAHTCRPPGYASIFLRVFLL